MQVPGHRLGGPDRQAVGAHDGLDVRAGVKELSREPGVNRFAFDAERRFGHPVAVEQLAVENDVGPAFGGDPAECGLQVLCLGGQDRDAFVAVAVGGGPGDADTGARQLYVFVFAEPDEYE